MQIQREVPYLKAECQRRGIHPPYDNPTAAQLIPIIEERLAIHAKHFGRTFDPSSGYYGEWKLINDDLERFLAELNTRAGVGRPTLSQRAASVNNAPTNPPPSSVPTAAENASPQKPTPTPTSPPKNILVENAGLSGSTVANQQPAAESEAGPGWPEAGPTGSGPASTGSGQPKTAKQKPDDPPKKGEANKPIDDEQEDEEEEEEEDFDEDDADEEDAEEEFNIKDYLDEESIEASLDLQSHLTGRSPLDKLTVREQKAIVRLLKDYPAWRVVEVLAQPRPHGFNLRTSKSAINAFRERFEDAKEKAAKDANQKAIDELMAAANTSDDVFQTAVQRCIKSRLLTAASDPNSNLTAISALVLSLTRLRKQAFAEQKQSCP
jgi:hypothetical protein